MRYVLTFLFSFWLVFAVAQSPESALSSYLYNNDNTLAWELRDSYRVGESQAYSILLISQKWQGMLWKHELLVFIPDLVSCDGALLFVSGGSVDDGLPRMSSRDDGLSRSIASIAYKHGAVTAILKQVPNQPLFGNLYEDALISYTLDKMRQTGDYSLPLLFPMVKSAVRAMDVVADFAREQRSDVSVNRFMISGASKRGWTTWLSGAVSDSRVVAIAPMVIDMLNMPVTLKYQQEMYGEYSDEINDYVKLDIPQTITSDFGRMAVDMIDPYSYRDKLTMPKMLFMGTNDPYWTIDAVKHYIDSIPGKNFLCYVPNVGHGLGDQRQAFASLSAFFGLTMYNHPYPECRWLVSEKNKRITLSVQASAGNFVRSVLWSASSDSRDFRNSQWTGGEIIGGKSVINLNSVSATLSYPKTGYIAFYIELIYSDMNGNEFSVTTRPYVADGKRVFVR